MILLPSPRHQPSSDSEFATVVAGAVAPSAAAHTAVPVALAKAAVLPQFALVQH